ncbi:hypothetical protein FIBSPDRAFT_208817 [Athelia psychrophila]|uniref:Uncharacterized protein n=1 Tax=Athelia psychrophila TaxID=1759441 RepID=A0A166WPD0_9AGAM|nr:hypothetical protein FIBSPDRAFT_208817 [Fibularhizoctonia sp. CBS 109695]
MKLDGTSFADSSASKGEGLGRSAAHASPGFLYGFHASIPPNPVLSSHASHSKLYWASLLRCRSALDATFSEMFYDAPDSVSSKVRVCRRRHSDE